MARTCNKAVLKKSVYFIPGTMCNEQLWHSTWAEVGDDVKQLFEFVHLPIPCLDSIDDIVQHLGQLISKAPGAVVGFSLGGYLAGRLALAFSPFIQQLMIVSNSLSALPQAELAVRSNVINWLKRNDYAGISTERILALLHPSSDEDRHVVKCIKMMDAELGQSVVINQLSVSTQRDDILLSVCNRKNNVTFVLGDSDPLVDLAELRRANSVAGVAPPNIINDCGHMLPLEQAKPFADTITKWLMTSA